MAGSTGTLVPPKGYLERLRAICDAHGILLVFDEVITGFGRLGTAFAVDAFGVMPDIVTMAKALTNGAIPMGAVAVTDAVHATIVDAAPEGRSSSSTAIPIPGTRPPAPQGWRRCESTRTRGFSSGRRRSRTISSTRSGRCAIWASCGTSAAIGLLAGVEVHPEAGRPGFRGTALQKRLFWNGCHVKWTGDTAIVAPALVAERGQVDEIVDVLRRTLAEA